MIGVASMTVGVPESGFGVVLDRRRATRHTYRVTPASASTPANPPPFDFPEATIAFSESIPVSSS